VSDGYSYPNTSNEGDRRDVLRNKLGIETNSDLAVAEYRITSDRRIDIERGQGPPGNFDAAHLKAIHKHLFGEVYEWAGHTRNERPIVDGQPVEMIATMRKDGYAFLPGSRIETGLIEALAPIRNPDVLRGSTIAEFSEIAGKVLADLNHVHPFREGNGRSQLSFLHLIALRAGHPMRLEDIEREAFLAAMIRSFQGQNDRLIEQLRGLLA